MRSKEVGVMGSTRLQAVLGSINKTEEGGNGEVEHNLFLFQHCANIRMESLQSIWNEVIAKINN